MRNVHELRTLQVWVLLSLSCVLQCACSKNCPPGYDSVGGRCKFRANGGGAPDISMDVSAGTGGLPTGAGASGGATTGTKMQSVGAASSIAGTGAAGTTATDAKAATNAAMAGAAASSAPSAMPSNDPCSGHANETVCVQAVMHHCDATGTSSAPETCASAMLCQVGKADGMCAACSPGTYHCDGARLNRCSDAGQYELTTTCSSEALCKESGACTDMLCKPNEKQCASDGTLKTCSADGSAFVDSQNQVCGKDLCDARNGACFVCVPGAVTCSGSTAVTCSADGQKMTMTECKASNDCSSSRCVEGTGCSAPMNLPAKTMCSSSGGKQCDGSGQCVGCVDDSACGDKKCSSRKTCVQCTGATDCPGGTECVEPVCNSDGTCGTTLASLRPCTDSRGNRGSCVAGQCICTPNCLGKCAGADGCGGVCPNTCSSDQMCQSGACVAKPAGKKIYETCNPGSDLQGDCDTSLACVGIGGRGPHCYHTPPCGASAVEVFGMVCAQYCLAPLDSTNAACPADASYCIANALSTDNSGYCIP